MRPLHHLHSTLASSPGNTWRVFEINVSNGNVTFTDLNAWANVGDGDDGNPFRTPVGTKRAMNADGF